LINTTFSNSSTYLAINTHTLIIIIFMHPSIFGMHFLEPNSELHKLNMVFATCVPFLLALHEPRLQIGKCCELNHEMRMLFLECNEKL
jgi:hypothetical protein